MRREKRQLCRTELRLPRLLPAAARGWTGVEAVRLFHFLPALSVAATALRADPAGLLSADDKIADLCAFTVTPEYAALREALGSGARRTGARSEGSSRQRGEGKYVPHREPLAPPREPTAISCPCGQGEERPDHVGPSVSPHGAP